MARPIKSGFDYFPFDVGFFRSLKIRATIGRFGVGGVLLFIYLLAIIYGENGYYIECNDDLIDIAAADLQMTPEKIGQIINFFCKRSLFDNKLFTTDKVLTSAGIQKRYQLMAKKRAKNNKVTVSERFWILNENETQSFIQVRLNSENSEKNSSYSKKNSCNSEKNNIKESKVNKSKVNKSRAVLKLPCTNGIYDVMQEQVETLQQVYKNIDVMESLLKMADFANTNPNKQRPLDGVEVWIRKWLTEDNNKAIAKARNNSVKNNAMKKKSDTSYDINDFMKYDIFD